MATENTPIVPAPAVQQEQVSQPAPTIPTPTAAEAPGTRPKKEYPKQASRGHWRDSPEFFDDDVQASLVRLHTRLKSEGQKSGATIATWRLVFRALMPSGEEHERISRIRFPIIKIDEEEQIYAWAKLWPAYRAAPVEVADLLSATERFRLLPPKQWSLGNKILLLSQIAYRPEKHKDSKPLPLATSKQLASLVFKWFGNRMTGGHCRKVLSEEIERRNRIFAKWDHEFEGL